MVYPAVLHEEMHWLLSASAQILYAELSVIAKKESYEYGLNTLRASSVLKITLFETISIIP